MLYQSKYYCLALLMCKFLIVKCNVILNIYSVFSVTNIHMHISGHQMQMQSLMPLLEISRTLLWVCSGKRPNVTTLFSRGMTCDLF